MVFSKNEALAVLCIPLILVFTIVVMYPGLSGPFLLDDLLHFPKLEGNLAVVSWQTFHDFIFSGDQLPGRFLGFLSLLINDHAWPSHPYAFKYTNLMLHLLNGVLVFCFIRSLLSSTKFKDIALKSALVCMLIWLIHPMQISTVMYVIQRITILSSTFILAGLCLYVWGRSRLDTHELKGYLAMSIGVGFFGLLALFVKEIAVNIFLYILVIEVTLYKGLSHGRDRLFQIWSSIFVYAPIILIALYFISRTEMLQEIASRRDFTITERVLTESRVIFSYLGSIIFPKLSNLTLYHDDFVVSRGLFNPLSTIVCVTGIIVALLAAILVRSKLPILALAVLWFLAGHLLESTFIPIEIYFEHRNYLPMLGIVLAVVVGVFSVTRKIKMVSLVSLSFYVVLLSAMCFNTATVWGNSALLTNVWMKEHPTSIRAVYDMVRLNLVYGQNEQARSYLLRISDLNPSKTSVLIFDELHFNCTSEGNETNISDEFLEVVRTSPFDQGAITGMKQLNYKVLKGECASLSVKRYIELAKAYSSNPAFHGHKKGLSIIYESIARAYKSVRDLGKTIEYLERANEVYPRYKLRVNQAFFLMSAGLFEDAQEHLDKARSMPLKNPFHRWGKDLEIRNMQRTIDLNKEYYEKYIKE